VYVIDDHFSYLLASIGLIKQPLSQCCGRDFWNVLVLANRFHFGLAETAKTDAIL
jgi:hypothetical protein